MYKTLDSSFEMSWSEQALQIVDEAGQNPAVQEFPQFAEMFFDVRRKILDLGSQHKLEDLLALVNAEVEGIVSGVRTSVNVDSRLKAHELLEVITEMRRKLFFLQDYFDFQLENVQKRFNDSDKISLLPSGDFIQQYPQHEVGPITFRKRIKQDYSTSFNGLADKMGFPVADTKEIPALKVKLAFELWRVYNKKNNFAAANRTYFAGTDLPIGRETIFHMHYFDAAFGGFAQANREVILDSKIFYKDEDVEKMDEAEIGEILRKSLKLGRVPEGISENKKKAVAYELEADLKASIDRMSVYFPQEFAGTVRHKPSFNWRQLLVASKYFGEYGVKIYDLWLGEKKLQNLTNHSTKIIEGRLKDLFFDPPKLAHMRKMPALFGINPEDVPNFEKMSKSELKAYINEKVLDQPFSPTVNPTCAGMRTVLKIFAQNGISVAPSSSHFVAYGYHEWAERILNMMVDKMKFFEKHPEIPLYMRQVLLAKTKTSQSELEATIAVFEAEGIDPKWYVHFLHVGDDEHLRKHASKIKSAADDYNKIEAFHAEKVKLREQEDPDPEATKLREFLLQYIEPELIPSKEDLAGKKVKNIKRHVEAKLKAGEVIDLGILDEYDPQKNEGHFLHRGRYSDPVVEGNAIAKLIELGYPFDEMSINARHDKPSTVLERVELMLSLFGEVRLSLLDKSLDVIKGKAKKIIEKRSVAEVQELRFKRLMKERGWTPPPPYLKILPPRIMQLIDEIESRDVPFQSEYWWWLNGSASQRDAQIEETWRKLSKDSRRMELGEMYGFKIGDMPRVTFDAEPDKVRQYFKILATVGYDGKISWSWLNLFNSVKFRCFFRDRLVKNSRKKSLTLKEDIWRRKINMVGKMKNIFGDKVDGVAIELVFEEAEIHELEILENDRDNPELVKVLAERVKRKQQLEAVFRRYRFGYADMDYFTFSMERVELAFARIADLEKFKIPVTREILYREVFELASEIGITQDENLGPEQMDIVVYLENLDCDPFWARKLVRGGETLDDFRSKVEFLQNVELDVMDYGKAALEISDYENLLDKPLAYIKRAGLRRLKLSMRNYFAHVRLAESLGDKFSSVDNWKISRTSKVTMWSKLNLLQGDALKGQEAIVAELVTGYSKESLEGMVDFIGKIYIRGQLLGLSEQEKSLYIQVMVGALHSIARMFSPGIINKNILDRAKQKILCGHFDQDFINKIKARDVHGNVNGIVAALGEEMVLKIYNDVVDTMVLPEVPEDRFLTADEEKRLALMKDEGDKKAFEMLVTKNLRLVVSIAKRYLWSSLSLQELIQEGNVGLMKGVEKFDWKRGYRVTTCVTWWIRAAVGKFVKDNAKGVRLPVYLQDQATKYIRTVDRFQSEHQRMPEEAELAVLLGVEIDEVEHYRDMAAYSRRKEVSFDAPMYSGDGDSRTRLEVMGEKSGEFMKTDVLSDRRRFLGELKEVFYAEYPKGFKARDWDIFLNRFGFNLEEESLTLEELGEKHGITRERVRQLEGYVLDFIRSKPEIVQLIAEMSDSD